MCNSPSTSFTYTVTDVTNVVSISNGPSALSFISVDMTNHVITISDTSIAGVFIIQVLGTVPNAQSISNLLFFVGTSEALKFSQSNLID
jgi:hypothetical protein